MSLIDLQSSNFDFRFWGASGAPKGAPKIEVHGTYPCMVSSKHPGTPTPTIFVPPPENQLVLWNVSDGPCYNLTLKEAVDLAQNRPIWRLMSTLWRYALLVVHASKEEAAKSKTTRSLTDSQARPGWTTSIRGQDSPWKSQTE